MQGRLPAYLKERSQNKLKEARVLSSFTSNVGDVVLIKDGLPRGRWRMGRIHELIKSRNRNIQLDAPSDRRLGGRGFNPRQGRQHSFVVIDHEMFSTVILSLPLIQEGQLSVSGERMCTRLVNRLED